MQNYNGTDMNTFTEHKVINHNARMDGIRRGKIDELSIHPYKFDARGSKYAMLRFHFRKQAS